MPAYSKVVSVVRQIDTAHVFIGGMRKDITSGWVFVDGVRKQVFPSAENYTKVYEKTTAGSYSETLSWGKYRIVISGAGGAGGAGSATHSDYRNRALNGYAGEQTEITLVVDNGETKTVSGVIGGGAASSYANATQYPPVGTVGTPGASSAGAGQAGQAKFFYGPGFQYDRSAAVSGSGGGASSVSIDSGTPVIAKGGNGGNANADEIQSWSIGGAGGAGGTTSGTGAAGGNGVFGYKKEATSGSGADGYIHIYKSNLYPN